MVRKRIYPRLTGFAVVKIRTVNSINLEEQSTMLMTQGDAKALLLVP